VHPNTKNAPEGACGSDQSILCGYDTSLYQEEIIVGTPFPTSTSEPILKAH
jgi:hypothetical protein